MVYTYANRAFLGVYNAAGGDAAVYVPGNGAYRDLIGGEDFEASYGRILLPPRDIRAYLLLRKEN